MKVKTNVKAGGVASNHNQTLVLRFGLAVNTRKPAASVPITKMVTPRRGVAVNTSIKSGGMSANHNQCLVRT